MTQEEIQEFIRNAPANVGDIVWAWDVTGEQHKGVLIAIYPMDVYPYVVTKDEENNTYKFVAPYTAPPKRPMTHKECFELMGKWVFCADLCVFSDWHTGRRIEYWTGCPISELVEPLEDSPWRALEVEE